MSTLENSETADESALLEEARKGDAAAFQRLVAPHLEGLRELAYRVLGHSADAEDAVQTALEKALRSIDAFEARSSVKTWLWAVTSRTAIDQLRARRPYVPETLGTAEERSHRAGLREPMVALYDDSSVTYDAREHLSFCFTCVGRTLDAQHHVALVLREIFGFEHREVGQLLGVSESVARHAVTAARSTMEREFDGLCRLVDKRGVCDQCRTLRAAAPEARRGPSLEALGRDFEARLALVRRFSSRRTPTRAVHDFLSRAMDSLHGS